MVPGRPGSVFAEFTGILSEYCLTSFDVKVQIVRYFSGLVRIIQLPALVEAGLSQSISIDPFHASLQATSASRPSLSTREAQDRFGR
jgi:hypothetical protein